MAEEVAWRKMKQRLADEECWGENWRKQVMWNIIIVKSHLKKLIRFCGGFLQLLRLTDGVCVPAFPWS